MKRLYPLLLLALLWACADTQKDQTAILELKGELERSQELNARLLKELEEKPPLVHLVLFKVKPDADLVAFNAELTRLKGLKEVAQFELGDFEELGDKRALSEYQMLMYTAFQDTSDYRVYQNHPTHLEVRENLKPMLAGPPAVYDYRR